MFYVLFGATGVETIVIPSRTSWPTFLMGAKIYTLEFMETSEKLSFKINLNKKEAVVVTSKVSGKVKWGFMAGNQVDLEQSSYKDLDLNSWELRAGITVYVRKTENNFKVHFHEVLNIKPSCINKPFCTFPVRVLQISTTHCER